MAWSEQAAFRIQEGRQRLTALGIPTPIDSDSSYAHLKTRGYAQWGRSTVYTILKDESYTGVFYHYRWKRVNGHMTHNRNREEWRTIVDGLDVQVVVFRKNGEIWRRLTSILRPQGQELSLLINPIIS